MSMQFRVLIYLISCSITPELADVENADLTGFFVKKVLYKNVCKLTKGLKASSEIIPLISRRNIHHLDIHNPCVSQF